MSKPSKPLAKRPNGGSVMTKTIGQSKAGPGGAKKKLKKGTMGLLPRALV